MVSPLANSNSYIMIDESCGFLACGDEIKVISTRFEFTAKNRVDLVTKQ
jgi:molybdopterin molybdotransferase